MKTEDVLRHLLELNIRERFGKKYHDAFGADIEYNYWFAHLNDPNDPYMDSELRTYIREHQARYRAFSQHKALGETSYIREDLDMETEHLDRFVQIPGHKHDFIEFVSVLHGVCTHEIEDHSYLLQAGDFTIIPPGIKHRLQASEDCVCLTTKVRTTVFSKSFHRIGRGRSKMAVYLKNVLDKPYYNVALTVHTNSDEFFVSTLLMVYDQQSSGKAYSDKIVEPLWIALLAYLLQNYADTAEYLVSDTVGTEEITKILDYAFDHYETITLSDLANHFYCSASSLSTQIHKITGRTFSSWLKSYRLKQAEKLLKSTDYTVDTICAMVGYSNTSQFIRSFKDIYGNSPYRYRKEHTNDIRQKLSIP